MELSSEMPPNLNTYLPLKEQQAKEHTGWFMGLISSTLLFRMSYLSHLLVTIWLFVNPKYIYRIPPRT